MAISGAVLRRKWRSQYTSRSPLPTRWRRGFAGVCAALFASTAVVAVGSPALAADGPKIEVLSNRADLVSGGDALVEVTLPDGAKASDVRVELDGRDVTHEFGLRSNGRYQGVVTGLREGANELTARVSRSSAARLTVTNHSKQGPIFAGKQVEPWICETAEHGLGPATGLQCVAPTRYDFFYKSAVTGDFEDYDPGSPPSAPLIAATTTDEGETVPFIVRRERGVINRGIYDIAVLYDPGEEWEPWTPQKAWNGKLHWIFIGDCNPGHRQAGGPEGTGGPADVFSAALSGDLPLSRGHAVGVSTLTKLGNNCNDVVSAETVMMVKEHLAETYGPIRFTTAEGSSGGSIQQFTIANNYPGLLDGIMPFNSWADIWNVAQIFHDCRQLDKYFEGSPALWADPTDRMSVTGEASVCAAMAATTLARAFFDPSVGCATNLNERLLDKTDTTTEPEWAYDPQTNPDGVRCTIQDYQQTAYGRRDSDGFANRALDDAGIQFGLTSLLNGTITAEQFVDLNVKLGGRDIDYDQTPRRTEADVEGLRNAYRSGRVNDASQLDTVPIMELRHSTHHEIHPDVYTQMVRARLVAANGHADNHAIWTHPGSPNNVLDEAMNAEAFVTLDQWVTAVKADASDDDPATKVVRNKPTQAKDTCWVADKPAVCGSNLPHFSSPRLDAGAPMRMDILKCQLKPIDWDDYGSVDFTEEQKRQLDGAFPDGVCDWTKPGVEQQPPAGVWQTFAAMTGGEPLGPAPKSVSFRGHP